MNDVEVWRTYPEFPFIEGSTMGHVRTTDRYIKTENGKRLIKGRILKQQRDKDGYLYVAFSVNGKTVHRYIHRIAASCFLINPDSLPEANHKNGNRTDNNINNLEWCTHEYNMQYKEKYGISSKESTPRSPVFVINLTTLEVYWFPSQCEASRVLGVNDGSINSVLKCRRKQAGGNWFINADSNAVEKVRDKFGDVIAEQVEKLIEKN